MPRPRTADRPARRPLPATAPGRVVDATHVVALGRAAGNRAVAAHLEGAARARLAVQRDNGADTPDSIRSVELLGGGGGIMNLGVYAVEGRRGQYIVKGVNPRDPVRRAVYADRVLAHFGLRNTGTRPVTGPAAYALVDEMLSASTISDDARAPLHEMRGFPNLKLAVMNRAQGASWRQEDKPTATTAALLRKPEHMRDLGKIYAIDVLLGNSDRMRHTAAVRSPGLRMLLHPDNLMAGPEGFTPIDQDAVLPSAGAKVTARAVGMHSVPMEDDPVAYRLATTRMPMARFASGAQSSLSDRFQEVTTSSLLDDAHLQLVAEEMWRGAGPMRPRPSERRAGERAFVQGVHDILGKLGEKATRRALLAALDEVYQGASKDERGLLDKGALRNRQQAAERAARRASASPGAPRQVPAGKSVVFHHLNDPRDPTRANPFPDTLKGPATILPLDTQRWHRLVVETGKYEPGGVESLMVRCLVFTRDDPDGTVAGPRMIPASQLRALDALSAAEVDTADPPIPASRRDSARQAAGPPSAPEPPPAVDEAELMSKYAEISSTRAAEEEAARRAVPAPEPGVGGDEPPALVDRPLDAEDLPPPPGAPADLVEEEEAVHHPT